MRLAVISDIHANIHALDVVLADIDGNQVDQIICLGDLVGYGVFPNECIEIIAARKIPTVMGNYDDGVGFERDDCGCVYKTPEDIQRGDLSLVWTKEHTSAENKMHLQAYQKEIRQTIIGHELLFVHGSPRKTNEYLFEDRSDATFARIAKDAKADVIFFGHTHLPYTKQVGETLFVNTGSVGKPKDGNLAAGYVLVELNENAVDVKMRRLPYNVKDAANAIRQSEMPDYFADVLEAGSS